MPLIPTISCQPFHAFLLVVVAVALGGCAITVQKPANNATITLPSKTNVVVTGNASYTGLKVTVDGADVSSQMVSTGPSSDEGDLNLAAGSHTISASADVYCWYCTGAKTQSTDTNTFVVSPGAHVCAQSGGPPVFTINADQIATAQQPGRKLIGMVLLNSAGVQTGDVLLIIVDDAPGLQRIQMRVELDIDPFNGVTSNKAIEAWGFCHSGSRVNSIEATMLSGFNVGTACSQLTPANDFRSGCTITQTMLLDQSTTSELWLRKPGWFFGVGWDDVEGFDSSIWQAFGGRSVRFIWRFN
jgi:hypothetical protein